MPSESTYRFHKPHITRDDFLSDFIAQLIQRRKNLGLSQEDIDTRMGNADRLCSKWECGLSTPTSFNLFCWIEVLESQLVLSPEPDYKKRLPNS